MRSIAAGLALSAAVLLSTAAPAVAHEMAPTTSPAAGTGVPVAAAAATAGPDGTGGGEGVAGLAVAVAVAALGAYAVRRRSARLDLACSAALVFAGVAHLALVPSHWAEGRLLGAFFVASGALLVAQGAIVAWRPSPAAYASVLASTVVMVVLYVLAREAALPLVDHRDPYLVEDVPVKVAEAVAALAAGASLLRTGVVRGPDLAARSSSRTTGLVTSA